jgi:hypothetical protein
MMNRHLETLFCDDIRQEIGGKLSFIGVYSAGLFVTRFPALLPKLCLAVKVVTPADQPFRSLQLRVFQDEGVLQEIRVGEAELAAGCDWIEEMTAEQAKPPLQVAQFMLVYAPLQLTGPCTLGVRVQTEDSELHGMALRVNQAQIAGENSNFSQEPAPHDG